MTSWSLFQPCIFMISRQYLSILAHIQAPVLPFSALCSQVARTKKKKKAGGGWFKFLLFKSTRCCCTPWREKGGNVFVCGVGGRQKRRSSQLPQPSWAPQKEMIEEILHTGAEDSTEVAECTRIKGDKKKEKHTSKSRSQPQCFLPYTISLPACPVVDIFIVPAWERERGGGEGSSAGIAEDLCYQMLFQILIPVRFSRSLVLYEHLVDYNKREGLSPCLAGLLT